MQAEPEDADRLSERGWEQARGLGERLQGEGIEAILASPYGRAQETAQAIGEVLGLAVRHRRGPARGPPVRRLPRRLAELRRAPATSPGCRRTAPEHAEPGAESFSAILARVASVQAPPGGAHRRASASSASRTGASCTSSSAPRSSARRSRPQHLPALYRISHINTGITLFHAAPRLPDRRRPLRRLGAADLERPGAPVGRRRAPPGWQRSRRSGDRWTSSRRRRRRACTCPPRPCAARAGARSCGVLLAARLPVA